MVTEAEAKTVRIAKILRLMRDNDSRTEEMMREMEGDYFTANLLIGKPDKLSPCWMLGGTLSMATGGSLRLELGPASPTLMARCRRNAYDPSAPSVFLRRHSIYVSVF